MPPLPPPHSSHPHSPSPSPSLSSRYFSLLRRHFHYCVYSTIFWIFIFQGSFTAAIGGITKIIVGSGNGNGNGSDSGRGHSKSLAQYISLPFPFPSNFTFLPPLLVITLIIVALSILFHSFILFYYFSYSIRLLPPSPSTHTSSPSPSPPLPSPLWIVTSAVKIIQMILLSFLIPSPSGGILITIVGIVFMVVVNSVSSTDYKHNPNSVSSSFSSFRSLLSFPLVYFSPSPSFLSPSSFLHCPSSRISSIIKILPHLLPLLLSHTMVLILSFMILRVGIFIILYFNVLEGFLSLFIELSPHFFWSENYLFLSDISMSFSSSALSQHFFVFLTLFFLYFHIEILHQISFTIGGIIMTENIRESEGELSMKILLFGMIRTTHITTATNSPPPSPLPSIPLSFELFIFSPLLFKRFWSLVEFSPKFRKILWSQKDQNGLWGMGNHLGQIGSGGRKKYKEGEGMGEEQFLFNILMNICYHRVRNGAEYVWRKTLHGDSPSPFPPTIECLYSIHMIITLLTVSLTEDSLGMAQFVRDDVIEAGLSLDLSMEQLTNTTPRDINGLWLGYRSHLSVSLGKFVSVFFPFIGQMELPIKEGKRLHKYAQQKL